MTKSHFSKCYVNIQEVNVLESRVPQKNCDANTCGKGRGKILNVIKPIFQVRAYNTEDFSLEFLKTLHIQEI